MIKRLTIAVLLGLCAVVSIAPADAQRRAGSTEARGAKDLQPPVAQSHQLKLLRATAATGSYACPFCDLHGANLSGRNLTNANLQGANLEGANLKGANLSGAILSNANLTNANLQGAKLNRSDKGRTDLSQTILTGANLKGVSFDGTDLQYTDVSGIAASGVDLSKALKSAVPKLSAESAPTCGNANLSNLKTRIYVATTGNDNDSCGTNPGNSCATISKGIARCGGSNACGVLVMWGEYKTATTIALVDGVNVYGGCTAEASSEAALQSLIDAPAGGEPAVSASGLSKVGATLQGFRLQGSAPRSLARASVALTVSGSAKLSVIDTRILAGPGAAGAPGSTGGNGTDGATAKGATAGSVDACSESAGGNGSVIKDVSVDVGAVKFTCKPKCSANNCYGYWAKTGAAGGKWGGDNCAECVKSRGHTGDSGANGGDAACGRKGTVSNNTVGSFSNATWQPSVSGGGTSGNFGGGGGGGGAGGYKAGACFWVKSEHPGNQGGGGGAGGCGGAAGGGGQQGGASFAVTLFGSPLTLTNSAVVGGRGGTGGTGGSGGKGGNRGSGADGLSNHDGGYGGKGGTGGAGGAAGGGAGGNGGPAIGIALVSNSKVTDTATVYYTGASGAAGGFGTGGQPVVSGVCAGPNGDEGKPGAAVDKQTF